MSTDTHPANDLPVVIIGGGLAGLACSVKLHQAGVPFRLLEASDRVGGRVRSDSVDGLVLDHGFQALLTAYPACQELLDYPALNLQKFDPGAFIRWRGKFKLLGDPWRRPGDSWSTLFHPAGSLGDKLRVASLRRRACRGQLDHIYERPPTTTMEHLIDAGFTRTFIDAFFRPFLGGVFLESELATSSRMLQFVFRMFASGDVAVPAAGMQAIPTQLADQLPPDCLQTNTAVTSIENETIHCSNGRQISARRIIVATESDTAKRLLGNGEDNALPSNTEIQTQWNETACFYFTTSGNAHGQQIAKRPMLFLAGDEIDARPINHLAIMNHVAPSYCDDDHLLISANVVTGRQQSLHGADPERLGRLQSDVHEQLVSWFGGTADDYEFVRSYYITHALPTPNLQSVMQPIVSGRRFVCGDHRETPSIQGAMNSGLRTADAVMSSL